MPARLVRFGAFELDVRAGELRKHGIKIRLQEQPFRILLMLVEHPGEVVLRDEIRKKLWPNDTIVEFDHSINAAIKRLRDALGDSAYEPRYVETLERRGYRFIGEVEGQKHAGTDSAPDNGGLVGKLASHYRVVEKLGSGGMGVVYRAEDLKLGRQVALKFLPEELVKDTVALGRFEREARAASALNHPHICTIHGLEHLDGQPAMVMELIEGETLDARLAKGPVQIEHALAIAIQVAGALAEAHHKGIAHLDLKPGNIMLTKSGVKVLDFGLARVARAADARDQTVTQPVTLQRPVLGTPRYMSPEQAQGKEAGVRSDIFSFGVVLHEMLTGEQLFERETTSETLAAVLKEEPDLTRVPVKVRRLLQACLQKDPNQRLQAIDDARLLLEDAPQRAPEARSRILWAVVGAFAIVATVALAGWWRATRLPERALQPLVHLDVDLGREISLGSINGANVILSPDGTRLVWVSQSRLFTRRLDQPNATELAETEGAWAPFFSPDGEWVAFAVAAGLRKVSVQGGAATTLCTLARPLGGTWGQDGNIVAAGSPGILFRIPSGGGAPVPLTELASGEGFHRWPQILPGGRTVLFSAGANLEVMSLGDRRRKRLQLRGTYGRYLPSGHLVYSSNGTLFAVPFDLDRLEVRGSPAAVLGGVAYEKTFGSAQFDFAGASSGSGMLVYRSGGARGGQMTVQWLYGTGNAQPLLAKPADYRYPHLSPDGDRLVLTSDGDICVYDLRRETMTRLTFGGGPTNPIWSPDGRYIVFGVAGKGMSWTRADGAGKPQPLTQNENVQQPWSFSADGKRMAFHEINPQSGSDLWTLPLESAASGLRAGTPEVLLQTSFDERHASFSPDGRWFAYSSNKSGAFQVYVRSFPEKSDELQISNSGGVFPVWSRKGNELLFRTLENQVMAATYTVKRDSLQAAKPRLWSEKRLGDIGFTPTFDVTLDDRRIAALMPAEGPAGEQAQNHVIFLLNFFDELRRRFPAGDK